jgi:hypothetical protein
MGIIKKTLLLVVSSLCLSFGVGSALAECGIEAEECLCHNIGGPMDLGANCDPATGTCSVDLLDGSTLHVREGYFLGIIIPPTSGNGSDGALAAHIAHGDGFVITEFDPPLHLAYTGQIHKASNVECLARRILPQPPEPGN